MCFSASASFAASAVTSAAGVVALTGATKPAHRLLGSIPIVFAIHQFAEGVLWLALSRPEHAAWARPAMLTFLSVAEIVWPALVPLAILAFEDDPRRRRLLSALLVLGVVLAVARAYGLWAYPVSAGILGHHIQYRLDTPWALRRTGDIAYALVTVGSPLVSSNKLIRFMGLVMLVSLIVTKIFFYDTFISVWCFVAAIVSALVVLVVKRAKRKPGQAHASAALR